MNEGVIIIPNTGLGSELDPKVGRIIQAQVWANGMSNPINDEIMESDGVTLQRIFWGDYAGPGPGPSVPMDPVAPVEGDYAPTSRMYEALDARLFDAIDNRIFEA
jgi:hypothetical protein